MNLEFDKKLSTKDAIGKLDVSIDNLPLDDPSQWTRLYNSPVTSEEIDWLLSRRGNIVIKQDDSQSNPSQSDTFNADYLQSGCA